MAENEEKEEKKIIIDEDWKKEAQKEKEILAAQEQAEKQQGEEKQGEEKQAPQQGRRGPLPKGDFAALVSMLVTQTFFSLGLLGVEGQEPREPDLELARYNIDMLETLQAKTKGNLTPEEDKALESMLHQVRMGFVKVSG